MMRPELIKLCAFSFVILVAGGVAHADLVAWYPFDEGSGLTAFDASGRGHDGTLSGDDPTFSAAGGAFGGYLSLPGFNEIVSVPDDPDFQFEMGTSWAASVWYRRDGTANGQALITKGYHGTVRNPNGYWQLQTHGKGFALDSRCCSGSTPRVKPNAGGDHGNNEWNHFVVTRDVDNDEIRLYVNGELTVTHWPLAGSGDWAMGVNSDPLVMGSHFGSYTMGDLDDVGIWKDESLDDDQVTTIFEGGIVALAGGVPQLHPGDADQDLDFDQIDLVQVQIAAKYLTGEAATWGDGDWNGGPGGSQGNPPTGNGFFDQVDIIASLSAGKYLTGPYGAITPGGEIGDGQTSIVYDADDGSVSVDAPAGTDLTSVNIDSATGIFVNHENSQNLDGSFDTHSQDNIFKATFGSTFGSLSFGMVATAGLEEAFVAGDLSVIGSLDGGGGLGDVDLVYIPEPSTLVMLGIAIVGMLPVRRRRRG